MTESGYYPSGAEFDANAPWNKVSVPERSFGVCISQALSKSVNVVTDDYHIIKNADYSQTIDTSDTSWVEVYNDCHYTPLQLIGLFKKFLEKHLPDPGINIKEYINSMKLIEECTGWVEDETEVVNSRYLQGLL